MTEPVNRTILLLDIEKFGQRDDVEQAYLRRMLYDVADRTLGTAGIDETQRLRADRGDSVMELIDANASVTALLRALLTETPALLHTNNRLAASSAQIRLRAVLATGYVAVDDLDGWVGSDLNQACRLLDSQVLRTALSSRDGDLALCVSETVHHGVVRHGHPGIRPEEFHPVTVEGKEGPIGAWLHGVPPEATAPAPAAPAAQDGTEPESRQAAQPGPPGQSPPLAGSGATFTFNGGSPSFGGSLVVGDQHGVSGGQVTGDIILGGAGGTDRGERT